MIKNKFIKSTLILILGGLISKIMAMVIRIYLTRNIGPTGLGLYMLVLPTFGLFITIANLGLPIAVSKLVSEKKNNNKKLVLSIIPLIILFNISLMLILIISSKYLATNLLKNSLLTYPIMAIGITLPFITISDILRGYFFGKERMWPYTISNNLEQLVRLLLVILLLPKLLKYSLTTALVGVVLFNVISEGISILILMLYAPKDIIIKKEDFKLNKYLTKEALNIAIPTTASRLIGTISAFLEPIILMFILNKVNYTPEYITLEYGIINGYVLPILLLPSFFSYAISNALLPIISNSYTNNNKKRAKKKTIEAIIISLIIGIPVTLIFITIPQIPLNILYKTSKGTEYIKFLAPIFLLHYIQSPLTTTLQGMGKAKCAMYGTILGTTLKIITLASLSLLKIGLWGLVISISINIITVTIHHIYYTHKYLKN